MNDNKTLQELILVKDHKAICLRLIGITRNEFRDKQKLTDESILQIVKTALKLLIKEARENSDRENLELWIIVKHYVSDYFDKKDLFPD
jgi:hypothetical protein